MNREKIEYPDRRTTYQAKRGLASSQGRLAKRAVWKADFVWILLLGVIL